VVLQEGALAAQPEPVLYTPVQVAIMLGIARTRVFKLLKTGELKSVQIGRSRRILPEQVRDYVNSLLEAAAELQESEPHEPTPLPSRAAVAKKNTATASRRQTTRSRRR
jgi:excisionase family DNA binding protein